MISVADLFRGLGPPNRTLFSARPALVMEFFMARIEPKGCCDSRKSQMVFRMFEASSSRNSSNLFLGEQPLLTPFGFWGAVIAYFGLFFVCIVSVTPKSTCPPLTSFSGIRSSRRINLPFVRLRLLLPDSAAGASFWVFGVFTFSSVISIRASSQWHGETVDGPLRSC